MSKVQRPKAASKLQKSNTAARKSINKEKTKQNDDKSNEVFESNIEIVTALLSTVPYKYSDTVRKWISKLFDPSIKIQIRNSYLAFLLFQMQNMKISDPFDKIPPNVLEDPAKMMAPAKWKTISQEAEKDLQERYKEHILPHLLPSFRKDFKTPTDFLSDQPEPSSNGIITYGGCFSNHFLH
ncbi:hypothetical protein PVAND_012874 [Polypedilum vanderplanki]|uniref:DUF4485 domain-containing protein n=1 Tax=Polypedilum vanderplanki TaxID=319348 RepID=A0A9J6CMZ4_POLVA|nr:hypothetical protein PVAND_012874 [Polypedilum vanderplanki]